MLAGPSGQRYVNMTDLADHYLKKELYELVRKDGTIFEFLQAGSLDGLWFWDIERPAEEWLSPRFKEVFGYADEEIPNTSAWWQANIFPEDLPLVLENFRRHRADPRHPYDQVVRYRHKNGSTVWIRCRGIAIRNASGQAIRMLGAHTDVTAVIEAQSLRDRQAARVETDNLLEGISDAFISLDHDWRFTHVNARAAGILRRTAPDLIGKSVWAEFPEGEAQFGPAFAQALKEQRSVELEAFYAPFDRWLEVRAHPTPSGLSVFFRDITPRKRSEAMVNGQNRVLQMVAQGAELSASLHLLLQVLEAQSRDMLCSVLLLDEDGQRVRHGAAPNLPPEFSRAIDGAPISPTAGSCGTAIFRREPVFVADIATDPLWTDYRQLALPHGLRACWSTPIIDARRTVLGSFAIYYRQPGLPDDWHRELIGFATHTAAICISQQRTADALCKSEARYALAVRGTSEGLWEWDVRTNADYLSPRWKELLGFADHELPNHADSFFQRLHPDDFARAQAAVQAHLERHEPYDLELRLLTKSGEYRWFRSRGQAEWDENGRPLRMAGAISDITDRKSAENAMRDAAMFNRQIIMGANEGIAVLDRQLRYLVWNPYLEELLGLNAHDVLSRHPLELFPWMKEGGQLAALERALNGETIVLPDNQRMRTGTKRISWLQARLAPLRDARENISGVIVTITDVTERKLAEQQLRALAARLQSVREEQSAHIAREIHDVLGQQLTALKLDLAWLKRRTAAVGDPGMQAVLTEKINGASSLVDDTIRTVQKVATELRPGLLDKLGLAAALEHEARIFAARAGLQYGLELDAPPPGLGPKHALEIFRICQELLTNIARHAQATRFDIRLSCTGDGLRLEVADDGRGISEQQLAGQRSLGLLGMRERTQLMGGTLDIRPGPAKGTLAALSLPLVSHP